MQVARSRGRAGTRGMVGLPGFWGVPAAEGVARLLPRFLGGLLVLTAAAKVSSGLVPEWFRVVSAAVGLEPGPAWALAVSAELLLGLVLLVGLAGRAGSYVAAALFFALGSVALLVARMGYTRCGCAGSLPAPPYLVGLVDFVVAGLSLASGLAARKEASWRRGSGLVVLVGLLAFAAALMGFAGRRFAAEEGVTLSPQTVWVEADRGTGDGRLVLQVRNHTASPAQLVGADVPCNVHLEADLPVQVPPGGRVALEGRVHRRGSGGAYLAPVVLFVRQGQRVRQVRGELAGWFVGTQQKEE